MKTHWLILATLAMSVGARADDVLPKPVELARYDKMAGHSPFAPPTIAATPPPAPAAPVAPPWSDALTATMVMQLGDKFRVTIVDQNNPRHYYLTTGEVDAETHLSLVSVKLGANKDEPPRVEVRKDDQIATIRYEPGTNSAAMPVGAPGIPGAQPQRPPIPGAVGGIRAPAPPAVSAANPGAVPNGNVVRRPIIRANPALPSRPAVVNTPVRPNPAAARAAAAAATAAADDDDDDDE